jgi:3'-phosphoadenosine 5'-phosphosulfate sulfotransferase (PAPS reductase)/FAD synthetase
MKREPITQQLEAVDIVGKIRDLVARGALFVENHSGGKDSQAMHLLLRALVPKEQRVVVHADLGRVEWAGALDHIRATIDGVPIHLCKSRRDLLQVAEERGMFPAPANRWCTSDLKRGPIEKVVRHLTYARKAAGHPAWHLVVNCEGLRADESTKRKKMAPFAFNERNSKAGREWYDLLPVHGLTERQVFDMIAAAGQQPHVVYSKGMPRFSCVFCIYADDHTLTTAARLVRDHPELVNDPNVYRNYVALERSTGQVMMMPKNGIKRTLEEITGVAA